MKMETPAGWAGADRLGGHDRRDDSPPNDPRQTALAALRLGLRHRTQPIVLAPVLRQLLSVEDRLLGAVSFYYSLPGDIAGRFIEAADLDFHTDHDAEREAERQRRQWADHCARTWRARP